MKLYSSDSKTTRNSVIFIIVAMTLAYAVVWGGDIIERSIDRQEIYECEKLEKMSYKYKHFYYTEWQAKMCERHGFIIKAPVYEHK